MVKRLFDIILSLFGLVVFSPLLAYTALRIKSEDGGPVFYRGVRVGIRGEPFRIFKFRSMVVDAEKTGGPSSSDEDPRITVAGRFIRKFKLDELAQLFNVLVGDMSFVGPRPEVQKYVDMYTDGQKIILGVRPGITDWASLWNSDEGAVLDMFGDPDEGYETYIRPRKLGLQMKYVRERNLFIDMSIIIRTVLAVFSDKKPQAVVELEELRHRGKEE